jgi:thioredoxin reductase
LQPKLRPLPSVTPLPRPAFAGHEPATKFLDGQLKLDEAGYIVTAPDSTATSIEGVFAAGDVQVRRCNCAALQLCRAAMVLRCIMVPRCAATTPTQCCKAVRQLALCSSTRP